MEGGRERTCALPPSCSIEYHPFTLCLLCLMGRHGLQAPLLITVLDNDIAVLYFHMCSWSYFLVQYNNPFFQKKKNLGVQCCKLNNSSPFLLLLLNPARRWQELQRSICSCTIINSWSITGDSTYVCILSQVRSRPWWDLKQFCRTGTMKMFCQACG